MKLVRHAAAVAVVVTGGALALAAPASASAPTAAPTAARTAPAAATAEVPVATYNGACGSGHKVIDSANMENLGTTFLTYNKTTGENCVVTVRTKPGAAVDMFARLSSETGGTTTDRGRFTTYAGPVYLEARGECVTWEGGITTYSTKGTGHCGSFAAGRQAG
ncbi:spore-associated protein A [Streptomyces kunmingensis]|uniref:Spore-associated protein A n=1 Tax=Streptomyces kunmingensis TaxID=68225 RepID=A0ABU6C8E5_9ACTN|nr:spore-associated protein A [Streptomyces kunmingensis]MEB3960615.1 spore-associated protein A [Streptomyces kunmingensis]